MGEGGVGLACQVHLSGATGWGFTRIPGYPSHRCMGNIGDRRANRPIGANLCRSCALSECRNHFPETNVDTLQLKPRPTNVALIAWQFTGQPLHEWPSWVQSTCTLQRSEDGHLELRHARQSGTQIVYLQEWLVRDLDGGVCFYTDAELRKEFDLASSQ
jgi:hypothetical protein